jgi:hypothetical protein
MQLDNAKIGWEIGSEKSDCEKFRRWHKRPMRSARQLSPTARRHEASAFTMV